MGLFDDLRDGLATPSTGSAERPAGMFDDLRDGVPVLPASPPPDPNRIPVKLGFGYETSLPRNRVTNALETVDQRVMAPLARGITAGATALYDLPRMGYNWATGVPVNEGLAAPAIQSALDMAPRPADAGFGTDVLEAAGGGLSFMAPVNAARVMMNLPTLARGAGAALGNASAPELLFGLAKAPVTVPMAVGRAVVPELPGAVGVTVGMYGGEKAGEAIGGDAGKTLGGLAGSIAGGMIPTVAGTLIARQAHNVYSVPETGIAGAPSSRRAFDALENLGITPSGGLVGSPAAAGTEASIASLPFGGHQRALFSRQNEELARAADTLDTTVRGAPMVAPPTPSTVGDDLASAAAARASQIKSDFGTRYDNVFASVPTSTRVDIASFPDLARRVADPLDQQGARAVSRELADVLARTDRPMAPDDLLRLQDYARASSGRLQQLDEVLGAGARDGQPLGWRDRFSLTRARDQENARLTDFQRRIEEAQRLPLDRARTIATRLGMDAEGTPTIDTHTAGQLRQGIGTAIDDAVSRADPEAGARLREANADYRRVHGSDVPLGSGPDGLGGAADFLKGVERRAHTGSNDVYSFVVNGGLKSPERLRIVLEGLPAAGRAELSADILHTLGRRGQDGAFDPNTWLKNWSNIDQNAKLILTDGDVHTARALDDLALASASLKRRGSADTPRVGAGSFTGAAIGASVSLPKAALTAASMLGAGRLIGSRAFADFLANEAPSVAAKLQSRMPEAFGRIAAQESGAFSSDGLAWPSGWGQR